VGSCREGIYSGSFVGQVSRYCEEFNNEKQNKIFRIFVYHDQLGNTCANKVQAVFSISQIPKSS
jgi:hypothetical protein